eukprot:gene24764-3105_t
MEERGDPAMLDTPYRKEQSSPKHGRSGPRLHCWVSSVTGQSSHGSLSGQSLSSDLRATRKSLHAVLSMRATHQSVAKDGRAGPTPRSTPRSSCSGGAPVPPAGADKVIFDSKHGRVQFSARGGAVIYSVNGEQ